MKQTQALAPQLTFGERLFELACAAGDIQCRRIRTAAVPGFRRPDYKVRIPGCGAIVEVKEIAPNAEGHRYEAELAAGRTVAWNNVPGRRLRPLIKDAGGQLKRVSLRGVATAAAIFDTTGSISYTDPYNVKVAMFGLDALVLAVPNDLGARPYSLGTKNAGKAILTAGHSTSISAVVIIRALAPLAQRAPVLIVYHNHFARVPLDADRIRKHVAWQFRLGQADNGATDWIEL